MEKDKFRLRLKGKTCVFIDWANVYGWQTGQQKAINPSKLYQYLRKYKEIDSIRFYFGLDKHPKSKLFLDKIKKIGFTLVTKDVKYIPVNLDNSHFQNIIKELKGSLVLLKNISTKNLGKILKILDKKILRRKCDFDIEIAMDVYKYLNDFKTFIFFSGDGDFAPLLNFLLDQGKQLIVIFKEGHLGKEIAKMGRRVFLCNIKNIPSIA